MRLDTDNARYQLNIRSLRDLLLDDTPAKSLTYRMRVSSNIARSIIFLHSASFVHKNIRPETIITTEAGDSYLVGFQWFRAAAGDTYLLGDAVQSNNLYRHPTRQGQAPEEMYSMQHDVYSLGVCLLEIGLWKSFVTYGNDSTDITVNVPGIPEAAVQLSSRDRKKHSYEVKHKLTDLAKSELPSRMGERFAAIVVSCLTCLDKDSDLGSVDALLEDDNGVILGVNYIQKVRPTSSYDAETFADRSRRF
jgi:serine/threonine protein kinase